MATSIDRQWMLRALELAERGQGFVEPNPMVGAVILDAQGERIGEGWHERFGGPHAEVNALRDAGNRARNGTLYVTLEPCCHLGKTPPCTDAVLASGVRRVVAAMPDPFPRVAGGGLAILRDAGLEVDVGVGATEARRLNAAYLKRLHTGRPWVISKWAMTLDGKIATRTGDSKWISSEESRQRVHELRGRVDAVIVGRGTVVADDPLLTGRPPGPRTATRVVVSASGELPEQCRLRTTARDVPVIVYTRNEQRSRLAGWAEDGAEIVPLSSSDMGLSLDEMLTDLGRRGMTNVLVEGGGGLLGSFFSTGNVDEIWAFVAPVIVGGDGPSPVAGRGVERIAESLRLSELQVERIGGDILIRGSRFAAPPEEQQ